MVTTRQKLILFCKPQESYLLRDDFTDIRAAGTLNNTKASDNINVRTVYDIVGNYMSIDANGLCVANGTGAWNTYLSYLTLACARTPGEMFLCNFRVTTLPGVDSQMVLGWGQNLSYYKGHIFKPRWSGPYMQFQNYPDAVNVHGLTPDTQSVCVALRANGAQGFMRLYDGLWKLMYISPTGTYTPQSPIVVTYDMGFYSRNWRVPEIRYLAVPLVSDGFSTWGVSDGLGHAEGIAGGIGSGGKNLSWIQQVGTWAAAAGVATGTTAGGIAIATVDVGIPNILAEVYPTRTGGNNGIVFWYTDASNYCVCYHDGTNLHLDTVIAGATTSLVNSAVALTTGRIVVKIDGPNVRIFASETYVGAEKTITTVTPTNVVGLYSTNDANTFDNFAVYAVGNEGQYNFLAKYLHSSIPYEQQLRQNYVNQRLGYMYSWNMSAFSAGANQWADPDLDPNTFAPTGLDVHQWIDAAQASPGCSYAVLTTKHHDGFALWPTAYFAPAHSPYSIAQTAWYAGSGSPDVVGQFVTQCRAHNLSPVLYFSIWDRTYEARSGTTAATDPAAYIAMIEAQLLELLTNYGAIGAIWFDGWADTMGVHTPLLKTNIPYATIYNYVKSLQPNCLIINNSQTVGEVLVYESTLVTPGNAILRETVVPLRTNSEWFFNSASGQLLTDYNDGIIENPRIKQNYTNCATYLLGVTPNQAGVLPAASVTQMATIHT